MKTKPPKPTQPLIQNQMTAFGLLDIYLIDPFTLQSCPCSRQRPKGKRNRKESRTAVPAAVATSTGARSPAPRAPPPPRRRRAPAEHGRPTAQAAPAPGTGRGSCEYLLSFGGDGGETREPKSYFYHSPALQLRSTSVPLGSTL